jgi:hypothetical protein
VPLSEHEKRQLEQMERALHAEDPKLASSLRGTDLRGHRRRRAARAAAGFVLGMAALLTGVIAKGPLIAVGVLGFVIMLASALFAVAGRRNLSAGGVTTTRSPSKPNKRPAKRSVTGRFEDRWRKRRDQG